MTTPSMKTVCGLAAAVLDELTDGLGVGDSRRLDRKLGFMPVQVDCLQRAAIGLLYSVAHHYPQNGDLVPDPDVVFVRRADGWSPVSFQDSVASRIAVTFHGDGAIEVDRKEQEELVRFCNHWMRNIREQQGLSVERSR